MVRALDDGRDDGLVEGGGGGLVGLRGGGGDPRHRLRAHLGHLMSERGDDVVGDVCEGKTVPGKLQKRILVFLHHGGVLVLELVEHAGQHKSRLGPKLAAQALRQRSRGCARLSDARDVGVLRHHPLDGARDVAVVPRREPGMICELAQLRQRAQSLLPLGARDGAPKFGLLLVRRSLLQRIQNIRGIGEFVRVRKRTRRRGIAAGVRAALAAVDVHRLRLRAVPVLSKSASRARRSGGRGGRHLGHLRLHPRAHLLQQIAAHRVGAEPAGELDGQRLGGVANLGVLALEEMARRP